MYTYDCKATCTNPNSLVVKFANDTSLIGLIDDESACLAQITFVVKWCEENNLILNVDKTKQLIVDFCRKHTCKNIKEPVYIHDNVVEQVDKFRLLGTHIANDLSWNTNCHEILKRPVNVYSFYVN